ncbi:MAG: UDP-N-acetylmuramate dehydrogenase [Candidatus Zixiibacteriota bacterium]
MYCATLPINGAGGSRWQDRIEGTVTPEARLSRYTSFRVGGPAKYLVVPATEGDVREVFAAGEEVFVMGAGTNLLVSDAGFDGIVLRICNALMHVSVEEGAVTVGAGRALPSLVTSCTQMGLAGMEWAIGVPGTVGGATCTNAGAFGSEIWEFVEYVDVLTGEGAHRRVAPEEVAFAYRRAEFPLARPFAVTEVALKLTPSDPALVAKLTDEYRARRQESQPVGEASAGSVFKNPPEGPSAGALIDQAGLKGMVRGGAAVSSKHANFIVNEGGAAARDIHGLIEEVRGRVEDEFGVTLELEVQLLGEFGDDG